MSPTEGTGRIPKPMRYRRYSARVQLVPRGMGAHTNKRKARPSGAAAMAARPMWLLEPMRLPEASAACRCETIACIDAAEAARGASRCGYYHKSTKPWIC